MNLFLAWWGCLTTNACMALESERSWHNAKDVRGTVICQTTIRITGRHEQGNSPLLITECSRGGAFESLYLITWTPLWGLRSSQLHLKGCYNICPLEDWLLDKMDVQVEWALCSSREQQFHYSINNSLHSWLKILGSNNWEQVLFPSVAPYMVYFQYRVMHLVE